MSGITLRPYQTAAIQALRIALAGGNKRVMCYSPTGSGKTEIGMAMIRGAMEKGKRVVFLCNRIGLVSQASKRFALAGIPHGVIQGDNTRNTHCPVIVASIQTVARRGMPDCDLIVIDEAHAVAGSKDFRSVIIERIFSIPGMGRLSFEAILSRDYPLIMGILSIDALLTLVGLIISDILYAVVDPRIKFE